jgi:hypothetical protein
MAKRCKSKLKSIYENGGSLESPIQQGINPNLLGIGSMAAGTAGSIMESTGGAVGTIGGGALQGAASGAMFGPLGMAVGAGLGTVGGIFKNKANKEAEEARQRLENQRMIQNDVAAFQNANSVYRDGGSLNQGNNITQYSGLPHDFGGLPLTNNIEVEDNETRGVGNTSDYIFSDTLRPDGAKGKKTFADISKGIDKKYKGYENDKFAVANKDKELSELMFEQEALKQNKFDLAVKDLQLQFPEQFNKSVQMAEGGFMYPPIDPPTGNDPTNPPSGKDDEWVPGEADFDRVLGKPAYVTDEELIAWNDMMEKRFPNQHVRRRDFTDLTRAMDKYAEKWNIGAQDLLTRVGERNPNVDFMADLQARKKQMLSEGMKYNEMTQALADYAINTYGDIYSKKSDIYGNLSTRDRAYYDRAEQMLRQRGGLRHTPGEVLRNTSRAGGAGAKDTDDSDFGWRNLISPQFIQPTEEFKSVWNPGETIKEEAYKKPKRKAKFFNGGGLTDLLEQDLQNQKRQIDIPSNRRILTNPVVPENPINNVSGKSTPQYETDPSKFQFQYNPNLNVSEGMKFADYQGKPKHWTNDPNFVYTQGNVQNALVNKGFSPSQVRNFFQPGYSEQFFDYLATNPNADFSRSQFKNDRRFGPEHMMALEKNKDLIPGDEPIQFMKPKPLTLDEGQPELTGELMRQNIYGDPPTGDQPQDGPQGGPGGGQGRLRGFRPDWLAAGVSTLPGVGMGIGNLALANKLNFQRTAAEQMEPDYVDPTRAIQEVRDQYAGAKDVARQVSSGSGNLMSNLIGTTASQSKATSGVASQYDNINADISNQAERFNAGARQRARDINAQIQAQEMREKTALRQQGIEGLMQGLNTGINTYYQSKRDADMMNIAGGENFEYRSVGPAFNQTPVKVFKGNGYHYYQDPRTGQTVYLDPNTGEEIQNQ